MLARLALLQEGAPLPEVGAGDLLGGVTAATVLGLIVALVRIAVGQADKRASVAEEREKICTATLTATTATIEALTVEVRHNGHGLGRLEAVERGVSEVLEHLRRQRLGDR